MQDLEGSLVQNILDAGPVAITILDSSGIIVYANNFATELFGITREQFLGRRFDDDVWTIRTYDGKPFSRDDLPYAQVEKTGRAVFDVRHTVTSPAGGVRYLSINASPLYDQRGLLNGVVAVIRDDTDSVRIRNLLQLQRDLLVEIDRHGSTDQVCAAILNSCIETDEIDAGAVYLREEESPHLGLVSHTGFDEKSAQALSAIPGDSAIIRSLESDGKPMFGPFAGLMTAELLNDPRVRELTDTLRASAVVPLIADGEVFGTLNIGSRTVSQFSTGIRSFLESLASWAGDVITKRRAEDLLYKAKEDLADRSLALEEANTALRVVLEQRSRQQEERTTALGVQVSRLILPYLRRIRKSGVDDAGEKLTEILEANLRSILSGHEGTSPSILAKLTPRELEVASLIQQHSTTKEIAETLNLSIHAVAFHRKNIRRKLGLSGRKGNLVTVLSQV